MEMSTIPEVRFAMPDGTTRGRTRHSREYANVFLGTRIAALEQWDKRHHARRPTGQRRGRLDFHSRITPNRHALTSAPPSETR